MEVVEKVRKACPNLPLYVYHTSHRFNCHERGSYDESAEGALQRALDFFKQHIG
jgi:carboxymethylenebutenolidase